MGDVDAVAVGRVPDQQRLRPCSARGGMGARLENECRGRFAEREAVALGGERPAARRHRCGIARRAPSGTSTRIACQLASTPGISIASLPPAMATSIQPARIARIASPIATADDAQAQA
jgi:hypothetical protein